MAEVISGLSDLRMQFSTLRKDMVARAARSMVVSAGAVLRREAKQLAQEQGLRRTGAMIANIAIKHEKTQEGVAQYNLGVRHGRELGRKAKKILAVSASGRIGVKCVNDPFYWRFLEFGWVPRGSGKKLKGGERRRSEQRQVLIRAGMKRPATPFIGPSLENKRNEAIEAMKNRLARIIERANKG